MTRYAENTSVASDRSRAEIEKTLERYGARKFMYGWEEDRAMIAFEMEGRRIRFILLMPDKDDELFTRTATGLQRNNTSAREAYEQATRQRWRALALVIKAKLEAVESHISTLEDEFMAHIQLPNGETVGEWMKPQIEKAYRTGDMPSLLPGGASQPLLLPPASDKR